MSVYGRYVKRLRQGSKPGEVDAENRAKRLAAQIERKFATSSRQRRRHVLFHQMFAEVSKMYGREPRRARRKIARVWAKRPAEEVAA